MNHASFGLLSVGISGVLSILVLIAALWGCEIGYG